MLERAATVIVPSEFILDVALACSAGIQATLIPPGVRAASKAAVLDAPPDFTAHAPKHVVAIVGAVGPHKGSGVLQELAAALNGSDIGIVVIGYTDTQVTRGWLAPGIIYVHGAYEDGTLAAWLAAYRAETVLFPNRLPESFSYTLSEVWSAGIPVIVPDQGALGDRVERDGGGWRLPAGFGGDEAAALLVWLSSAEGAAEHARVKSRIVPGDARRIPTLEAMSRDVDALYARFGLPPPDSVDAGAASEALAPLLASESRRVRVSQGAREAHGRARARARSGNGAKSSSVTRTRGLRSSKPTSPSSSARSNGSARKIACSPSARLRWTCCRRASKSILSGGLYVRGLDVSIVTFRPDLPLLEKLIASIAEQAAGQERRRPDSGQHPGSRHDRAHRGAAFVATGGHLLPHRHTPFADERRLRARTQRQRRPLHGAVPARAEPGLHRRARRARAAARVRARRRAPRRRMGAPADPVRASEGLRPRDARRAVGERRRDAVPAQHLGRGRRIRSGALHVRRGRRPVVAPARQGLSPALPAEARGRAPHLCGRGRSEAAAGAGRRADQSLPAGALRRHVAHAAGPLDARGRSAGAAGIPRAPARPRQGVRALPDAMAALRDDARASDGALPARCSRGLGLRGAARRRVRDVSLETRESAARSAARVDPDPHGRPRRVAAAGARVGCAADVAQRRSDRDRGRPADLAARSSTSSGGGSSFAIAPPARRSGARAPATSRSPRRAASGSTSSTTTTCSSPITSRC